MRAAKIFFNIIFTAIFTMLMTGALFFSAIFLSESIADEFQISSFIFYIVGLFFLLIFPATLYHYFKFHPKKIQVLEGTKYTWKKYFSNGLSNQRAIFYFLILTWPLMLYGLRSMSDGYLERISDPVLVASLKFENTVKLVFVILILTIAVVHTVMSIYRNDSRTRQLFLNRERERLFKEYMNMKITEPVNVVYCMSCNTRNILNLGESKKCLACRKTVSVKDVSVNV